MGPATGTGRVGTLLTVALLLAGSLGAQGVDTPEPGSAEAITKATTEPRFSSPWTSSVPDHPTIPSPTKFLGHVVGAPGELTGVAKIYAYYRALAAATPRVRVNIIGHSEEGREILLVAVGEERNVGDTDRIRGVMADLADPRRCDEPCSESRIAGLTPFYMLHGGIHSTETGSPEMLMELVYRLAVSNVPLVKGIRDRLVVLVNPVAEPDGRDRAVEWFYRHLKGKTTDYGSLPPISPPYWGKYVRHDNNRDGIQRKLALTRATQDAFLAWHPIVVHDLHESVPLLTIWTGTGPYNPNLEPSVFSEWHTIAFHDVATLTSFGMPGVWTYGFGEGFAHLYADSVAINHNAIGRGYETFGNGTAETMERFIDPDNTYTNRPVTDPDWYRVVPPPKRFMWSLRDNTNYMETAVLSALDYAASNAGDMLRQFYRRGARSVKRGETEKPYAIAIPEAQKDRRRLARLVNLLREHGIEVSRSDAAFKVREGAFPAGTYLVRMAQPYRGFALDLLLPQKYPADKAPYKAYDDVAWSLPTALGVETKVVQDEAVRSVAATLVAAPVAYHAAVQGDGAYYLVADNGQEAFLQARVRLLKYRVDVAEGAFAAEGRDYPAGTWIVAAQPGLRDELARVAADLDLDVRAVASVPAVPRHSADWPRLAVLQAWNDTQATGWVRMIFDDQKVPYTLIMDEDVRRGGLLARFDVVLVPHTYRDLKEIVTGYDTKFSPLAFTMTAQYPSHGAPTSSPDITGGFTWTGIQNIEDFVKQGGLLITLGAASALPLDGGIVRDVSQASTKGVYTPGSELRVRFRRPTSPLAYGYPETTSAFREQRPLYEVKRTQRSRVVLQWGTEIKDDDAKDAKDDSSDGDRPARKKEPLVLSGGITGESEVVGKPALLDIPVGKGRVVAFNFDPIHRYQTESDFRLVWNAILNWNDLAGPPAEP